jgi:hypothetical protein
LKAKEKLSVCRKEKKLIFEDEDLVPYDDENWQESLLNEDWRVEEEIDDYVPPRAKHAGAKKPSIVPFHSQPTGSVTVAPAGTVGGTLASSLVADDTQHPSSSVPATSEAQPALPPTKRPHVKVIREPGDIPSVRGSEAPKTQWIIDGHIVEGGIHLVSGQPGCMKTLKAQNEARAISAGLEIYGTTAVKRMCLYLDRENPLPLVQERFELLGIDDESNLHYWGMWNTDQPPLLDSPQGKRLLDWAKAYKPVIYVDPLNAFHTKDENNASQMREVTTFIKQLRFGGASVVILHHQGKPGVEGPRSPFRGSSELSAACDIGFLIEKKEDGENAILTVSSFKNRMGLDIRHSLKFDAKSGLFIPLDAKQSSDGTAGQAAIDAIVKTISENPGAGVEEIQTATGLPKHKLRDLLKAPGGLWQVKIEAHGKRRYFPVAASN